MEVDGLKSDNYLSTCNLLNPLPFTHSIDLELPNAMGTEDVVGLIIWSAIEMAVTLICIGIAVCRPLYKNCLRRILSSLSRLYSSDKTNDYDLGVFKTGCSAGRQGDETGQNSTLRSVTNPEYATRLDSHLAECSAEPVNQSDEAVLLDSPTRGQMAHVAGSPGRIQVTDEVRITRSLTMDA